MQAALYKQAVTLNNLGVFLIQQGAARQALETLRDAVDTLRACCDANVAAARDNLSHKVMEKVQKASQRAMHPVRSGKTVAHEIVCWEMLQVSSSIFLTRALAVFGSDCCVSFSMSHEVDIQDRDRELDSSVMLYNYALAHIALLNETNASQVNRSALSLLRLSFAILIKKIQEGVGDEDWSMNSSMESLTGLTIAVLSNLTNTLQREGRGTEAQACHEKLSEIIQALSAVEEMSMVYARTAAAAAA